MHTNRTSFDDTILILFIAYERKRKMNETLKMNILPYKYFLTMADTHKTCSITRILIRIPSGSAFRILGIELFIPGSVW